MTQSIFMNLHPKEYIEGFGCYPFAVNLDRCMVSCSTLKDLSNEVCVPNEAQDLNLSVFNMITGLTESKILTENIHHANVNVNLMVESQIKSGIIISVSVSAKFYKNRMHGKKIIIGILLLVVVEMVNI